MLSQPRLNDEDFSPNVLPAVKESEEQGDTKGKDEEMLPHQVASSPMLPTAALGFDLNSTMGSKNGMSPMSPKSPSWMAWAESLGLLSPGNGTRKSMSSRSGQWSPVDPYTYACGSPTIRNRQSFLSLEQLLSFGLSSLVFTFLDQTEILPEATVLWWGAIFCECH